MIERNQNEKLVNDFFSESFGASEFSNFADGSILYHYTSMNSFVGVMNFKEKNKNSHMKFWPSHIFSMNDPYEGVYFSEFFINRAKEYLAENCKYEALNIVNCYIGREEFLDKCNEFTQSEICKNEVGVPKFIILLNIISMIDRRKYAMRSSKEAIAPYILSFSKNESDEDYNDGKLPLWIPYADNGKGVRMGFYFDKIKEAVGIFPKISPSHQEYNPKGLVYSGERNNCIINVVYKNKVELGQLVSFFFDKILLDFEGVEELGVKGQKLSLIHYCMVIADAILDLSIAIKSSHYSHENEVRVVLYQKNIPIDQIRMGALGVIPHLIFELPRDALKQVLFGPTLDSISESSLKYNLEGEFSRVEFNKSEIKYRS